jgi:hypothetical protein
MNLSPLLAFLFFLLSTILNGQSTFFQPGEEIVYEFTYLSGKKDTVAKGEIIIEPTNNKWEYDNNQKSVTYKYTFQKRDPSYFKVGQHGLPIQNELEETTGYIESDQSFWMHPFRANIFYITEIAPFPEYTKGNLQVKIKNTLVIGEGWGQFKGESKSNYKIAAYKEKDEQYKGYELKRVKMRSKHPLGKSTLSMIVSDETGIITMNYQFFNKDRLIITRKAI